MRSSNESSLCRFDWRGSRLLAAAFIVLGMLAAASLLLSAMPRAIAFVLAAGAVLHGLRLARREASLPPGELWLRPADASLRLNFPEGSQSWSGVRIRLRGPLASLSGVDAQGRRRRLHWWPDTLSRRDRRLLRLAACRLDRRPKALPSLVF